MPSKAFKLAEAMVSNPVMSDMVENPTATPTQIAAVENKTSAISDTGIISVNTKNIVSNNVLTQSFDSNQVVGFNLTDSINSVSPIVSVFKEVPVSGVTSKGQWDVNANATNYEFFDEKPYSTYASSTLTPSATGDGTFTNNNAIVVGYQMSSTVNLNTTSPSITGQGSGGSWQVVEFDPTGNHVYMVSGTTQSGYAKTVYQYTMSTPHDLSTLNTTPANTLDMSSKIAGTVAHYCPLHITNSGYDLYFGDYQNDIIYQWKMSTAYDLSTASYHGASSAIFVDTMASLFIQPNGLTGYQVQDGIAGSAVLREFTMTTAWDITTASLSGTTSSTLISRTQAVTISPDGTLVIASDAYGSTTSKYFTMSPGYDLSSLSSGTSFTWQGNSSHTTDTRFSSNGALLYGWTGTYIYNYTTGSTAAFNAADVGKKVVGNSGSGIITGTSGTYKSVTAFADTSTISSWQLFGAQGKSDGSGIELSGYSSGYNISSLSLNNTFDISTVSITANGGFFKPDGTVLYFHDNQADTILQYPLSTAWDLSTVGSTTGNVAVGSQDTNIRGPAFSADGTKMYVGGYSNDKYFQYTLSTAWDVTSASYSNKSVSFASVDAGSSIMHWKSDGSSFFSVGSVSDRVRRWDLTTAWDISTASNVSNLALASVFNIPYGVSLNPDGTKMYIVGRTVNSDYELRQYSLSTAFDITTASYDSVLWDYVSDGGQTGAPEHLFFGSSGTRLYLTKSGANITEWNSTSSVYPYSTYSPALTNSSTGQINSSSWLDINSMTADETKNDGDIFYAVSTDNRTSWDIAKASDGVRKIAKNNSGTWQYNNDAGVTVSTGYDLSSISPDNKYWDVSHNTGYDYHGIHMGADGYHLYGVNQNDDNIRVWDLTTQWDISSAVYYRYRTSHLTQPRALALSVDGTKMYCSQNTGDTRQYVLSTAFDLTTYSGGTTTAANLGSLDHIVFKPDGTRVWTYYDRIIKEYSISTAWDLTSTVTLVQTVTSTNTTYLNSGSGKTMAWKADGTAFFEAGGNNKLQRVPCSTAWDISTMQSPDQGLALNSLSYSNTAWGSNPCGDIQFGDNGQKLYLYEDNKKWVRQFSTGGTTIDYATSETWVNGTNNNEHATLQQALGAQSFNRMNKAQLDAVADNYHFSQDSADTLDLMITPYAASGTSPISDGVTINYDAEALIREAIPGTDYVAEFPNNTTINIKSLVNTNMKVRAL